MSYHWNVQGRGWAFRAGARAAFGYEKYSDELYSTNKGYKAGYDWGKKKMGEEKK